MEVQEEGVAGADPVATLRALFSADERRRRHLQVEAALAEAEAELGVIPAAAGSHIAAAARSGKVDKDRVAAGFAATGHSMMALVEELARLVGPEHGGWVHWGATTQNIEQPGMVLVVKDAHQVICGQLADLLDRLADLADRTAEDVEPGRTHWQHAVPITFGYKVAVWMDQVIRHVERLHQLRPRLFTSMTGGAAGTFASLGARGPEVQAGVARRLGLHPMAVPSRATVDHFAELVCVLGLVCATAASIAEEVARLMSAEYGEVSEPIPPGDVGSSTMPQKRNSKLCGGVVIFAAQVRTLVPMAIDATIQSHEVDGSRSAIMDHALEQACVCTGEALSRLVRIIAGLEVYPDRMRANLELTGGMINAEAVMLALARSVGRQEAHHIVHDAALRVSEGTAARFDQALLEDQRVRASLDQAQLADLLDPTKYSGLSAQLAHQTSTRARETAAACRSARDW